MKSTRHTSNLTRVILRADGRSMAIWVATLGLLPALTASAFSQLYDSPSSLAAAASGIAGNPSLTTLFGPLQSATVGGLTAWRVGSWGATFTGLFSVLVVIRHTRAEEELGRRDLVGANPVGRHAPLAAAVAGATMACIGIGLTATVALVLAGQALAGSIALAASYTLTGLVFMAVAAVAAQVFVSARTARMVATSVLLVAFMLRMVADGSHRTGWLTWTTPLGWTQRLRPFAGEDGWAALLPLAVTLALLVLAFVLSSSRDVARGLLPQRPGPARAADWLRSPTTLAWRLQRASLLSWVAAVTAFGLMLGTITPGLTDLFDSSDQLADIMARLGGTRVITDAFVSSVLTMSAMAIAAFTMTSVLRLQAEEEAGRAESVLATATTRRLWVASHAFIAFVGGLILLLAFGLAVGVAQGASVDAPGHELGRTLRGALVQYPAVAVMGSLALAVFGVVPRHARASLGALAFAWLLFLLGAILGLDQWLLNLSPFAHTPTLPLGAFLAAPTLWLLFIAGVLTSCGLVGVARRDIN